MGGLLNFVFEKTFDDTNGADWCNDGPLKTIFRNHYSTTSHLQLKEGFKNLLFYEVHHPDKFLDYILSKKGICNLLDRDDFKILFTMIPDPSTKKWFKENQSNVLEKLNNNIIFIDTNVRLSNYAHCFHFFLEESAVHVNNIFHGYDKFSEDLNYTNEPILISELDNYRTHKFLYFNRTVQKYHRYRLFLDWVKGNFSDSYFSFLNLYDFYEHEISEIKKQYGDSYCNELEKLLPIELDTQNVRRNDNLVEWNKTSNNFKKELFLDSCINIVTETTFCGEELFISEKIVKPILAFQPFIVLGHMDI